MQTGEKHKPIPYRCQEKQCAKRISAKTGTVMEGSKLGLQVWMFATYLLSPKHLGRRVREFAARHNLRNEDTSDIMAAVAGGMRGERLRHRELIAPNGLESGARSA